MNRIIFVVAFLLLSFSAFTLESLYPFTDSTHKKRFERLIQTYRCVVCENQTLAESEATVARDLREIIYQKVQANENDEVIDQYLIHRFGNFIQYRPPFEPRTMLLWLAPLLFLFLGLRWVYQQSRKKERLQ